LFETLSKTQREIVFEKKGKFAVRACPGSGKTYSVAARLAYNISNWRLEHQGIATISFTNIAWQTIESQIVKHPDIKAPIPHPHFLGTIDSFINRFIFLPFGHVVMKCRSRPVLVGEPHGAWTSRVFSEKFFDNISFFSGGEPYAIKKHIMPTNWQNNHYILAAKNRLIKEGYANQEDASYFAMQILDTYPQVARALALRFPVLIVDEAQDTSEIQMRIIDQLIANGLNEVMLVGDPDQAIFEWNDARPHLFINKIEQWSDNSIILNENRRSSQNICNCTCRLSSLGETSIAINDDVKDCDYTPIVTIYDPTNMPKLIEEFKSQCAKYEIEIVPENAAIIYRSASIFDAITGIKAIAANEYPWHDEDPFCKDFVKGKHLFDSGDFKYGLHLVLKAIIKRTNKSQYCSADDVESFVQKHGFIEVRKYVYRLMCILPKTDCSIGVWVETANEGLRREHIEIEFKIKVSYSHLLLQDLFGRDKKQTTEYRLGTIHSVKGETFEAVLVILRTKGLGPYYKTLLKQKVSIQDTEELRIVYVGITRPRRLLMLAVPDLENKLVWENKLMSDTWTT
jgi:DNA helicase II / ATP-dependent DNA helicase PcrA